VKSENEDLKSLIGAEVDKKIKKMKEERKEKAYETDTKITQFLGDVFAISGILLLIMAIIQISIFNDFAYAIGSLIVGFIFGQLGINFGFLARFRKLDMKFKEKK
jgi:hypothetical protein